MGDVGDLFLFPCSLSLSLSLSVLHTHKHFWSSGITVEATWEVGAGLALLPLSCHREQDGTACSTPDDTHHAVLIGATPGVSLSVFKYHHYCCYCLLLLILILIFGDLCSGARAESAHQLHLQRVYRQRVGPLPVRPNHQQRSNGQCEPKVVGRRRQHRRARPECHRPATKWQLDGCLVLGTA